MPADTCVSCVFQPSLNSHTVFGAGKERLVYPTFRKLSRVSVNSFADVEPFYDCSSLFNGDQVQGV